MTTLLDCGATLSPDRRYRYRLWRIWSELAPPAAFCMLNPSTATEDVDDPTIRRCIRFAQAWGHGGIVVVNLFALRSRFPAELLQVQDPVGVDNDNWIEAERGRCARFVCAWGDPPLRLQGRADRVAGMIGAAACFGVTKSGNPRHPLYMRSTAALQPFGETRRAAELG